MKIVTPKQMLQIESKAFREGYNEDEFMEDAGKGVARVVDDFVQRNELNKQAVLLCGKGNNAGDAYVAGIHLIKMGYEVFAFQIIPIKACSALCQKNHDRFVKEKGRVQKIKSTNDLAFPVNGVLIDGIFGTGFRGKVEEPFASIIQLANLSRLPIIAIDIPSGLNGETGEGGRLTIRAVETAFLGLPKLGFFLDQGWECVGKLRYVDFGLPQPYIDEIKSQFSLLTEENVKPAMPLIHRNRNKYEAGYVVGLAGSPGMPGASLLSSWSALTGGAGIVKLLHPEAMDAELSSSPYELIKVPYHYQDADFVKELLNKGSATFIGPGMGLKDDVRQLLKKVLPGLKKPCVIDADALTILAEKKIALPVQTILTPHKGEMNRLLKAKDEKNVTLDFIHECQRFAKKQKVTLILKGGPSFVFQEKGLISISAAGDPGMATAGSGDVLTGLVTALLAQGLSCESAALLGTFIHGTAGEFAAEEKTSYCMMASDIIKKFPAVFRILSSR